MSLLRLLEISQVRRWLLVSGRHQVAVLIHFVGLVADMNEWDLLVANVLRPLRERVEGAAIALRHRPRTGQCVVGHGDFVMKEVAVRLVEIDALSDDALAILVQRNAAAVEETRPFEMAGFGFEYIVTSIPVLIDPFANAIAGEGRLNDLGPLASVCENSSMTLVNMIDQDIGGFRQHSDLHRFIGLHHHRYAGREAGRGHHIAQSAAGAVGEGALECSLVFGREGRLLSSARRFGWIEWGLADGSRDYGPGPLARQCRIYGVVECLRCSRHAQRRRRKHNRSDRGSVQHDAPPITLIVVPRVKALLGQDACFAGYCQARRGWSNSDAQCSGVPPGRVARQSHERPRGCLYEKRGRQQGRNPRCDQTACHHALKEKTHPIREPMIEAEDRIAGKLEAKEGRARRMGTKTAAAAEVARPRK